MVVAAEEAAADEEVGGEPEVGILICIAMELSGGQEDDSHVYIIRESYP